MEALARARHSAGIEFTRFMRKDLCSGDASGVKYEKKEAI